MGMWIRSQDKEILVECNAVVVNPSDNNDYYIYAYSKNDRAYLGHYSTKEKALKVLNVIQSILNDRYLEFGVFQMPQDSEVLENE